MSKAGLSGARILSSPCSRGCASSAQPLGSIPQPFPGASLHGSLLKRSLYRHLQIAPERRHFPCAPFSPLSALSHLRRAGAARTAPSQPLERAIGSGFQHPTTPGALNFVPRHVRERSKHRHSPRSLDSQAQLRLSLFFVYE